MLSITVSKLYKKQFKKLSKAEQLGINEVVKILSNGETLDPKFKDHDLKLNFSGFRECHIKPNLLLVYQIKNEILELYLAATGSHQEVFGW
ncbi:type II toxin-antitoxin system RelE/ParE family toxin [Campylobacter fetus]|uniref:type II toxin-antitoxin system RelE/ParE family toxin n=1 Tax=Campylobacter fetus TaxID=196 RepID=UPI0013D0F052|nr:type II toxin-antitoxin system YafQ family toxin [Campylobacter fetus]